MTRSRLIFGLAAAALLAAGCGEQRLTPQANPSSIPLPTPVVSANDCRVSQEDAQLAQPAPPVEAEFAWLGRGAAVFVGTLESRGQSQYATVDHGRPPDGSVTIFTPWTVSATDTWFGTLPTHTVVVNGGSVGCDVAGAYTDFGFRAGSQFLIAAVPSDLAGTGAALKVVEAFPIIDGNVLMPQSPSRVPVELGATRHDVEVQTAGPSQAFKVPGSAIPLPLLRAYVIRIKA